MMSSHYPSCRITFVHLYLVLLHPYARCQLLFHSVHCSERTPVSHHRGCVLVLLGFPSTFLPASGSHISCQTCIPPANHMQLPSAPIVTRLASWLSGHSLGLLAPSTSAVLHVGCALIHLEGGRSPTLPLVNFLQFPVWVVLCSPPPCLWHKDYLCSVFMQSHP